MTVHFEHEPSAEMLRDLQTGLLQHSLRLNRGYEVGDILTLYDQDDDHTRDVRLEITYITSKENACALSPNGLHPDYCILSLKVLT